ncbi:hypothetical protein M316_0085 [Nitrincola phage 1M3-16]|uniref:hypothetical protein n=1 Tax=Nitrincola phage 1M3-16 TaxID=1472912 RepID=UPI000444E50A|nr:hypothetical protein GJ22_gp067 [Nitrincola phage 1M3-16]AHX01150.1 hypothetical protein M316_0085 [Nitrincola phage 1M3-16]
MINFLNRFLVYILAVLFVAFLGFQGAILLGVIQGTYMQYLGFAFLTMFLRLVQKDPSMLVVPIEKEKEE